MRVVEIRGAFGLENLKLAERPEPRPGPGQLAVRLGAASLNFRDLLTVEGRYNPRQPLPLVPCSDGAGEIVAVGEGVQGIAEGDRVATLFAQRWISGAPSVDKLRSTLGGPLDGTLAETIVLDAHGVVPVPPHLTDLEAATLPCAALTAWNATVVQGGLTAGQTVLVQGTGGVAIFALQFARMVGARAIVTSASAQKAARARELGADEVIDYKADPEWGRTVRQLTGGDGVDLVVEVGGAGTLAQSVSAVRMGGRICLIGMLAGQTAEFNVTPVFMKNVRLQGVFVGHREQFLAMNRAIAAHGLRPVIDRTFALDEARQAFLHMAAARHFGKICIRLAS